MCTFKKGSEAILKSCPPAYFSASRLSGMYKGKFGEWRIGGNIVGLGPTDVYQPSILSHFLHLTTLYKTEISTCQKQ